MRTEAMRCWRGQDSNPRPHPGFPVWTCPRPSLAPVYQWVTNRDALTSTIPSLDVMPRGSAVCAMDIGANGLRKLLSIKALRKLLTLRVRRRKGRVRSAEGPNLTLSSGIPACRSLTCRLAFRGHRYLGRPTDASFKTRTSPSGEAVPARPTTVLKRGSRR